jgi:hypothetical protein
VVGRLSYHGPLGLGIPYLEVALQLVRCDKDFYHRWILTSIGDLRDSGEEEKGRQEKDKDNDRQVNPLYVLESLLVTEVEEDVRAKNGGDDGANSVESLGNVDSNLRVLRWAADWGNIMLVGIKD